MKLENEIELEDNLSLGSAKYYDKEVATDHIVDSIVEKVDKNIDQEMLQKGTIFKDIDKDLVKNVVKNVVELAIKLVLKKKFHVSFSTFDEAKKAISSMMDGNTKEAVKSASDVALQNVKGIDSSTKSVIKTFKNSVIDHTIDDGKYELTVRQTKAINRIQNNCIQFEEALSKNDKNTIQKKANALQKDMKEILPIKETISRAQVALDKYELWKNNGNRTLSEEENELIEKMNQSA